MYVSYGSHNVGMSVIEIIMQSVIDGSHNVGMSVIEAIM